MLHQANAQAEVRLPQKCLRYLLTRAIPTQVTIESVSDEFLLNIFRCFLDISPRDWPRLVHTCRKWRRITFASQGSLHLRLFCTHGTPVRKSLNCWPALPIVVENGGLPALCPPTPEDEADIMVALKQSDRVISISLTISTSLLKKLSTIERAFSELQDLVLLSRGGVLLTMPSAFQWGQRLRRLRSTGIAFPALLQPLSCRPSSSSSSTNLLDLQLHDSFLHRQFSPAILKNFFSEMTQLRSLSLHFDSIALSIAIVHFPLQPYGEHVVLPALTHFNYRGNTANLEGIVAIIDAPSLEDINVTFDNPSLALPKFKQFIDRAKIHRSYSGTRMLSSEPTIFISLKWPGALMRLKLQSLSKLSLMQVSSTAQICLDLSPPFWNNEGYLRISTTRPPGRMDGSCSGEFLELLNQFIGKTLFHLDVNHLTNFVHDMQPLGRPHENVLPALHKLFVLQPGPRDVVLREALVSFMISCRLSGHPIEVEYERPCIINEQGEAGTVYGQCNIAC